MKQLYILFLVLFTFSFTYAHEGNILRIDQVKIEGSCEYIQVNFRIENIDEVPLKDVKIELLVNDRSIGSKSYQLFPSDKFSEATIVVSGDHLHSSLSKRNMKILVTEIFAHKNDWGGWHEVDGATANYNDVGDFEIYGDAPWRMKIYDQAQNKHSIPLHILAHDANQILLGLNRPRIEFIDVYLKPSTADNFVDAVNFSGLNEADFDALFTTKSPDKDSIGLQGFESSAVEADAEHTLAFKEFYNENKDFYSTNLDNDFWYFTVNITPSSFTEFSDSD